MPRPPTKAQSITDSIAARIVAGQLTAGQWLPSERELAQQFDADRSTIRRALHMLAERGLITQLSGVGARVRSSEPVRREHNDLTQQVGQWRGFHVSALRGGHEPFTRTTVRDVEVDHNLARWLGVPIGTVVLERARVQGVTGEPPVQTATTWVVADIVDRVPILRQVDTGPGGIYSRLAEIGVHVRFEETVTCRLPLASERETLQIEPHQPVLVLWRRGYNQHDHIVEVTNRIIVGDRHELVYTYGPTT
jgi:GntR family transcriptional regulator